MAAELGICLLVDNGFPGIYCSKFGDLAIRGKVTDVLAGDQGDVELISRVSGVDDVERIAVTVESEKIKILSRDRLSSYDPLRDILIPLK